MTTRAHRPIGRPRALTEAQVQAAREAHANGTSAPDLAAQYGVSCPTMRRYLRYFTEPSPTRPRALDRRAATAVRLAHRKGTPVVEIARKYGVATATIYRYLPHQEASA
ncbi:helix-turn-helix domain-containing protein [Rhodococcus opacus]|uniref:helix-turn-helix domain-containing protein n=1 Tax=Rhodococcus opacus TaxID=37919 RepID=UPI001C47FA21|nr:helix-turn-helix domain-containing protein [Rhodococcus opacus]MBV6758407.1 helix-turn-helix domain-containing protein [Rhodococcus opacus]